VGNFINSHKKIFKNTMVGCYHFVAIFEVHWRIKQLPIVYIVIIRYHGVIRYHFCSMVPPQ